MTIRVHSLNSSYYPKTTFIDVSLVNVIKLFERALSIDLDLKIDSLEANIAFSGTRVSVSLPSGIKLAAHDGHVLLYSVKDRFLPKKVLVVNVKA